METPSHQPIPPFKIGQLVRLVTSANENGFTELEITKNNITTIFKSGQVQMIPPIMVVVEVVCERERNAHLFDEKSGNPLKDRIKVLCQWFSQKKGTFEERWFNSGVLCSEENNTVKFQYYDFKINDVVTLRTATVANQQLQTQIKNTLESTTEKIDYKLTRKFENLSYLPPKMVVTGIERVKDMPNLFDKTTGQWIRLASEYKVSCMWFDSQTGKFSEHKFMTCTLLPNSELKEIDFEQYLKL